MVTPFAAFTLLVDHDNAPVRQLGLRALLQHWLSTHSHRTPRFVDVIVRAYGGWYDETNVTPARFAALEVYQDCPTSIRIDDNIYRLRFEFADGLMGIGPNAANYMRITHTVSKRQRPPRLVASDKARNCQEPACVAAELRRWFHRDRGCLSRNCPHRFGECFERSQQKQVDMHLAMDLLHCVEQGHASVAVASDDIDLTPALLRAAGKAANTSVSVIRFERKSSYADEHLARSGITILQLPGL